MKTRSNKLYPPKKESTIKEMAIALVTASICLALSFVIINNFSNTSASTNTNNTQYSNNTSNDQSINTNDSQEKTEPKEEVETTIETNEDYILPNSDKELITEADLEGLTATQLRYARNEIYARHGRMFEDEELQAYFNSKSWYTGTISASDFNDTDLLTDIEKQNRDTIVNYEKTHN